MLPDRSPWEPDRKGQTPEKSIFHALRRRFPTGPKDYSLNKDHDMFDTIIQDALVIDGTGQEPRVGSLGLKDGRIAALDRLEEAQAGERIEARGLALAPGFIDLHSHADFSLPVIPTADSMIRQGVTTSVVGQCGLSPAPLTEATRGPIKTMTAMLFKTLAEKTPWEEWSSFGDYLAYLERTGISINVIPLAGQGVIRAAVMGFAPGEAGEEEMAAMKARLGEAMEAGAWGLSTGLIYPPGSFTQTPELIELARFAAQRGGFYFSHVRGESETLVEAVEEALRIGFEAQAPVQISHFKAAGKPIWEKSAQALSLIDQAREKGLDVAIDMYPYLAGSTMLSALLPDWAQEGGTGEVLARLADPATRKRLTEDMALGGFARHVDWSEVLICSAPSRPEWEGKRVDQLCQESDKTGHEWIFDALLEARMEVSMALFGMSPENRRREIAHPLMSIGSDGVGYRLGHPTTEGKPHPRNFGAFPRVLSHYVRQEKVLSLQEAVRKMTGLSADRLGLADRGYIREGQAADLVLFDPDQVADLATYENPLQYPAGIHRVLVNGETVVKEGEHLGTRSGRVLRRVS